MPAVAVLAVMCFGSTAVAAPARPVMSVGVGSAVMVLVNLPRPSVARGTCPKVGARASGWSVALQAAISTAIALLSASVV